MSRYAILTGLMAVSAVAQAELATDGFKYIGCIEANPTSFGVGINFFAPFSADQCQKACGPKAMYAALGAGCHCDEPLSHATVAFDVVDESKCFTLCIDGDESSGHCGGSPSDSGKQLYNLYRRDPDAINTEECSKHKTSTSQVIDTKVPPKPSATTILTVTSCPPGVDDCLLPTIEPTPADTKLPASSVGAGIPACPEKCGPPCPPRGCSSCPPGGCPPTCPPGCALSTSESASCVGSECIYETSAAAPCSSKGCPKLTRGPITPHVEPTEGPATTSAMSSVVASEGSHQCSTGWALLSIAALSMLLSLV